MITRKRPYVTAIFAFCAMFVLGFMDNIRGTVIPAIRASFAVSYASIGLLFVFGFAGYLVAVLAGGIIFDRTGRRMIFVGAMVILCAGLLVMFQAATYAAVLLAMMIMSLSFGAFDVGLNALAARLFLKNTAVMMNLLHVFFGLGAAAGPRYAGWLLSKDVRWPVVYAISGVLLIPTALLLWKSSIPSGTGGPKTSLRHATKLLSSPRIALFAALLGAGMVLELGMGNWLVNFLIVERSMSESTASVYMALFFLLFTFGRLTGGYISEVVGYQRSLLFFTVAAGGLLAAAVASPGAPILFSCVGYFVSILFPTVITMLAREFPHHTGTAMALAMTGGGLLQMGANWGIGLLHDAAGVVVGFSAVGLSVPFLLIMLFLTGSTENRATAGA